jgi:hypothetical protein
LGQPYPVGVAVDGSHAALGRQRRRGAVLLRWRRNRSSERLRPRSGRKNSLRRRRGGVPSERGLQIEFLLQEEFDQIRRQLERKRSSRIHGDHLVLVLLLAQDRTGGHVVRGFIICGLTDLVVRESVDEERIGIAAQKNRRTLRSGDYVSALDWVEIVPSKCMYGIRDLVGCEFRGLLQVPCANC